MKFKKIAAFATAAMLSLCAMPQPALAAGEKNETVYALLGGDGSVETIYVVNQLLGDYTDYGNYTDIKNLSTTSTPVVEGDKITFPDGYVDGGLYYQGTMTGELPMVLGINYYLDGQQKQAEELAGAAGHLKMDLSCAVNEKCDERVREGYMAQISLALDLNDASGVKADGATSVVTGSTMNLNFIVLPGKSGNFTVEADVKDFEMDGITITLLKGTIPGMEDTISETQDGFDKMISSADDMVDGTTDLKDGASSLVDGIGSLKNGMNKLSTSGDDIADGMQQYGDGLKSYTDGVTAAAQGSAQIRSGLDTLSQNADSVAGGIESIDAGLGNLAYSSASLKALAESLLSSSDPNVQALAQGTLQTLESVNQLSDGLDEASAGVQGFTSGVKQAAGQYHDFDDGLQTLAQSGAQIYQGYGGIEDGFGAYLSGVKKTYDGVSKLYSSVKKLPDNIQELIDGQIDFRDGIATAKNDLIKETEGFVADSSPAVSFASPDKNHPDTVQYIMKTPGIKIPEKQETQQESDSGETFFTRLLNLFS